MRPTVLVILDGWGVAPKSEGNAIAAARTPILDDLIGRYPAMTLRASGEEVGLSWGEMGNSEVGHLTIGAGRVIYQMLPRLDREIASGAFFERPAFKAAIKHVKGHNSRIHLVGLISSGRVHGMDTHCHALLELAKRSKLKNVYVHGILDGRDTLYNAGIDFVGTLLQKTREIGVGKLATLTGRFWAMDRDNRWDRTEKAYRAMVKGEGEATVEDPLAVLRALYAKEIYDEQIPPQVFLENGEPVGKIEAGDAVIFFNFRPDRMRQLVKAFVLPDFSKFEQVRLPDLNAVTMTEYEAGLPVEVVYPPEKIVQTMAEVLSSRGLRQLHIAETEKYAHVTFFLNGTKEEPWPGETRVMIPSPKVVSYDRQPAMAATAITDRLIKEMRAASFDVAVVNFANADMVGHAGNFQATVKACETIDACLGKILEATRERGGCLLIVADHGNAEELKNLKTRDIDKEHSTNPVPFIIVGSDYEGVISSSGVAPADGLAFLSPVGTLADVAPTLLALLEIPKPAEMTGLSLLPA